MAFVVSGIGSMAGSVVASIVGSMIASVAGSEVALMIDSEVTSVAFGDNLSSNLSSSRSVLVMAAAVDAVAP